MKNMKKLISVVFIAILTMSLFAGCGSSTASTSGSDGSLDRVKKAGKILIGTDDTYPPMEFKDSNGKLVGFDIEVSTAVVKKMGLKVQYVSNAWDGMFLALKAKKFDMVCSSVSITDERKKTMIFTDPYIYGGNAIFTKADNKTVNGKDDFAGKVIGVQAGTTGEEVVSKISGIKEVKKYDAMTDAFLDLQNGRLEAVVSDPQVGDYYMSNQKGKFKRIKTALNEEPEACCFRKEDKALRDAYNTAMNDLKKSGELSKISVKYFGYDIYKK